MDENLGKHLVPNARVKITQQIALRNDSLNNDTTGTVVSYRQRPTGSWFAHSKNDKLWLDRLVIRKDDGEITTLNLDEYTRVEILNAPPEASGAAPAAETPATT